MSQFSPIYFGFESKITSKDLNQIHLNQNYLKEKIDNIPNGIIRLEERNGAEPYGNLYIIHQIGFTVESNRLIRITTDIRISQSSSDVKYYFYYIVDGSEIESGVGISLPNSTSKKIDVNTMLYITPEPLSKGDHIVEVIVKRADNAAMSGEFRVSSASTTIEDMGPFRGQADT